MGHHRGSRKAKTGRNKPNRAERKRRREQRAWAEGAAKRREQGAKQRRQEEERKRVEEAARWAEEDRKAAERAAERASAERDRKAEEAIRATTAKLRTANMLPWDDPDMRTPLRTGFTPDEAVAWPSEWPHQRFFRGMTFSEMKYEWGFSHVRRALGGRLGDLDRPMSIRVDTGMYSSQDVWIVADPMHFKKGDAKLYTEEAYADKLRRDREDRVLNIGFILIAVAALAMFLWVLSTGRLATTSHLGDDDDVEEREVEAEGRFDVNLEEP